MTKKTPQIQQSVLLALQTDFSRCLLMLSDVCHLPKNIPVTFKGNVLVIVTSVAIIILELTLQIIKYLVELVKMVILNSQKKL